MLYVKVGAAVVVVVVLSVVLAFLWVLAAIGCVMLAVIVVLVIAIRRRAAVDPPPLNWRAEVVREPAPQVTVVHYHGGTHLHIEAGLIPERYTRPVADSGTVQAEIPE